ncbi:DUF4286 family protein [Pseudonocardia acidicola]|uniref:EthD domain-containing protein n=1 Tax=Pseudonocardia acidicola TaxID=2724939 RepID=A0ABX1S9I5_9PSEU|nr:DUF4286 family protein [Pseudonocardia acidicola]NMH98228.1 hypothetical protein [Pseudonocardia acidicola]
MARHVLVVHTRPVEGKDAEFNEWYDTVHLPDVLKVDGFVAAQRYRAEPSVHGELPEFPYLAIYQVEADSLPDALAALSTAAKSMDMGDSLDRSGMATYAYTAI